MLITKNPELTATIYGNIRGTILKEREGIHLSDLNYCLRKAYFRKMELSPTPTDEQCVLWMTGFAFQMYMFPLEVELPLLVDGIWCTPDIQRGIEVKSTRQSFRNFDLETMATWRRQILGYCKALNKLEYDLVVLFVCGNYAPPFPSIDCWHVVTTIGEVNDNWYELLGKRDKLSKALDTLILPEPECADWEWKYCENVSMCSDTVCYRKKHLGGKK